MSGAHVGLSVVDTSFMAANWRDSVKSNALQFRTLLLSSGSSPASRTTDKNRCTEGRFRAGRLPTYVRSAPNADICDAHSALLEADIRN